jgi:hypothetical protein
LGPPLLPPLDDEEESGERVNIGDSHTAGDTVDVGSIQQEGYRFPIFLSDTAPNLPDDAQWVLLRQLTDAPNGIGDGLKLYSIMKKLVLQDQGRIAAPNHVVHATSAALIWHMGYAEEALKVVREGVVPSDGLKEIWKLSQDMRSCFKEDDHDQVTSAANEGGNSSYDGGRLTYSHLPLLYYILAKQYPVNAIRCGDSKCASPAQTC